MLATVLLTIPTAERAGPRSAQQLYTQWLAKLNTAITTEMKTPEAIMGCVQNFQMSFTRTLESLKATAATAGAANEGNGIVTRDKTGKTPTPATTGKKARGSSG